MNYLLDRKKRRKKFLKILAGGAVLLILFFFGAGIFSSFSRLAAEIFHPIQSIGNGTLKSLASLKTYFTSKRSLYRENEELRAQIFTREAAIADYDAVIKENENLKQILGRKPEHRNFLLAAILSKPNISPYDTLVLDAGERQGVQEGALVFAEGDIPIGRIELTTPDTSRAVLFSSPGEKNQVIVPTAASTAAHSDAFWQIVGRGGGNFEMILPRDFALNKGDEVVMPGIRTHAVAVTETMLSDPRDAFKKALLRSPVNIQDLKFVQIDL